jgi:predicted nucleic acid-binding protein
MSYLVDANILSELTKPIPNPRVLAWLTGHESEILIDAIILAEIRAGIVALAPGQKRRALEDWFLGVSRTIECLPWDAPVAMRWADLITTLKRKGHTIPTLDSMIAASALTHDLTLATRNQRDFHHTGVKLVDPFAADE